jgi:hypothetical protein
LQLQKLLIHRNDADKIKVEQTALYNVLQMQKREEKTIYRLRNTGGVLQTTPRGIAQILTTYFREKYDRTIVDTETIQNRWRVPHRHRGHRIRSLWRSPSIKRRFSTPYVPAGGGRPLECMG